MKRMPLRGEIWYVKLPTDPPEKAARPVIIVSLDARNRHLGASTVLVAPLTGSVEKDFETHILLEPKFPLRTLSNTRVCQIADRVRIAMGCPKP
jgi:mRNA-degrading endonuclease toxin of MazEF toxin-antitoxin module